MDTSAVVKHSAVSRQPLTADALHLAAFRYYVNAIENQAIAVYASRPDSQNDIRLALDQCLTRLLGLARNGEDDCPDGYVKDANGNCVPRPTQ